MDYGMDYQGGGGGGYSNYGGASQEQPSSSQGGRTRRNFDEQTLIPVTIQMALNCHVDPSSVGGDLLLPDGRKIGDRSYIQIVGAVRQYNDQSTNVVYELEDGTGLIEVKQWLDDNDCTAIQELRQETLQENVYLKVIGQLKDYEGKKLLVGNSVRPLKSGNELVHHMLEVVYRAEHSKRADAIVAPAVTSYGSTVGFGGGAAIGAAHSSGAMGGGDSVKDRVLNFIRSTDGGEAGVHISLCIEQMPNVAEVEIRKAMEALAEEGHIYSTISEDTYKYAI